MFLVFLGLALTVCVVGVLGALAFLDVAFGLTSTPQVAGGSVQWQPPFLFGKELLAWAKNTASQQVRDLLAQRPGPKVATQLSAALRSGTDVALTAVFGHRPEPALSTAQCHTPKVLTPPEALELAAQLQRTRSRRELQEITDRASTPTAATCPLLSEQGCCLVRGAEPMSCRAGCSNCLSGRSTAAEGSEPRQQAQTFVQGVTLGMSAAVEEAHLDGTVCDFNGALIVALRTPNAAERWARGERMFETCRAPSAKS